VFIKDIDYNSLFVLSLSGFGEFGSVPSISISWKSLRGIGICSSLKVC
jgi:hypothetical protein